MTVSRGFPEALGRFVADMQTRLNFGPSEGPMVLPRASLIRPTDAPPEVFRQPYETLLAGATALPYTVIIPAYQTYQENVNARLVCCLGTTLHVLEDVRGKVSSVSFPVEQISYVEVGRILLYSWIRLHGLESSGRPEMVEIHFNTVTDYVLAPVVDWVRSAARVPGEENQSGGPDHFDYLRQVNLKLANYSRRSITPGDQVVQDIYQPEIRETALNLFGFRVSRKRANPHMAILTGRELILIQDGAMRRFGKNAVYGGIWHYVPLEKIASIAVTATTDDLLTLSVELPGDKHIECVFSASLKPQLDELLSHFDAASKALASPS